MSTANSPATSEGENVSEIQTLTNRALALNQATDWWNSAMIVALVLAAISAVAVVWTTTMALKRARQAGDVQAELIQAKDSQLLIDLRGKDVKIADAKRATSELAGQVETGKQRTALAQEDAAKAQLALKQYVDEVAKRQRPRTLPADVLRNALSGKPPAKAEILYSPEGGEPYQFALELFFGLWALKWEVAQPRPIPPDLIIGRYRTMPKELLATLPATMRVGGQPTGVTLVLKNGSIAYADMVEGKSISGALFKALADTLGSVSGGQDDSLPDDMVRIVVGAKP
jgi:hypothetical protein